MKAAPIEAPGQGICHGQLFELLVRSRQFVGALLHLDLQALRLARQCLSAQSPEPKLGSWRGSKTAAPPTLAVQMRPIGSR